jgi:hypothetical protein
MLHIEKRTHGRDSSGRLFLHQPMPRICDNQLMYIRRSGAHDNRHGRSEGFLAAYRQHRHGQLPRATKAWLSIASWSKAANWLNPAYIGKRRGNPTGRLTAKPN